MKNIAIYIALIIIFLATRLPKIGSFVTLDEPSWLSQGANFYYALGQREFENTVYEYQPAVTTMSIIALAMHIYFPEYRGLGQGYLDYEKNLLDPFMLEHGKDPLVLLTYSRIIQVFVLLILFLVLYYLLQYFLPKVGAVFAVLFISFDPYYLGLTRMLTHEAMLALFVLVSLVAFAVYLLKERKFIFILISGISAGLAQLSKSSAIAMLAGVAILLLAQIIYEKQNGWVKTLINNTKIFLLWFVVLAFTYFIFWPGMWVEPVKMLYQVYGNAFSYAFQGARLTVTEKLDVSEFSLDDSPVSVWDVAKVLLFRTTPFTWIGTLLGLSLLFVRDQDLIRQNRILFLLMWTNALAFIVLIGFSQGRNSPHYILSSYTSLNLLAAMGWLQAFRLLGDYFSKPHVKSYSYYSGLAVILLFQIWSSFSYFPYYYTYRNPILYAAGWYTEYPQKPYGEALEVAAQYLADLPDAQSSTAFVYYSRGCFSYYYPGKAISFRPYYIDGQHATDLLDNLYASDYLVVYYANQVQMEKYHPYLNILREIEPLKVISMDGYEYVWIYKVSDFPPEIFESLENL